MARKTKDEKAKEASAKGRSGSGAKGAKVKRASAKNKKAMVIKEKKTSSRKTLKPPKTPTASPTTPKAKHGLRYRKAKTKIDPTKLYPPAEAVRLVKETNLARFDAKVDLHLNTKDSKFKKEVSLPHPIEIKTSNKKPEAQKRKDDKDAKGGKVLLKSEKKTPLLHTTIGKISDKDEVLVENLNAILAALGHGMILKATLTSTMSPGVKVEFKE